MLELRFNNLDEFCEEVCGRWAPMIAPIRLTNFYQLRQDHHGHAEGFIHHVIASYIAGINTDFHILVILDIVNEHVAAIPTDASQSELYQLVKKRLDGLGYGEVADGLLVNR